MIYGSNWAGRDMELAAELIDRALSLGRTVPEVIRSAAPLLLALGQYDRARDITSGAIVENPRHPALWQARIETLLHLGDFMTAAEVAGQALRQWPDNPVFRQLLDAASRNLPEK
jgi:tetratricopeptide (TPR) repeat protein